MTAVREILRGCRKWEADRIKCTPPLDASSSSRTLAGHPDLIKKCYTTSSPLTSVLSLIDR